MRSHVAPFPRSRIAYSRRELSRALGVSLMTLDRRIADGSIRVVRLGGRTLIPVAEVVRLGLLAAPRLPLGLTAEQ